jgi:photosystem II stability/assembly factor-like uncharacterized protein
MSLTRRRICQLSNTFLITILPTVLSAQWVRTSLPDSGASLDRIAVLGTKIFAGTANRGLFFSTDDGTTWESPDSSYLDSGRVWFLSVAGTRVITEVGSLANFIYSSDTGRTWNIQIGGGIVGPEWFGVVPHGSKWFTMISNAIYVSNDSGSFWTPFTSYFVNKSMDVMSLAFTDTETFVGTTNGIYASMDDGLTWQITNLDFPIYNVQSICIIDSTILASTRFDGIYRAVFYRQPWAKADSGLTNPYIGQMLKVGNNVVAITNTAYNATPIQAMYFYPPTKEHLGEISALLLWIPGSPV